MDKYRSLPPGYQLLGGRYTRSVEFVYKRYQDEETRESEMLHFLGIVAGIIAMAIWLGINF